MNICLMDVGSRSMALRGVVGFIVFLEKVLKQFEMLRKLVNYFLEIFCTIFLCNSAQVTSRLGSAPIGSGPAPSARAQPSGQV